MMLESESHATTGGIIPPASATPSLVDTSVVIDGRIADIARAGFAPGKLLIPRFVLAELQLIADSGDAMKRSRGRRGLEMLHGMRESGVDMEIVEYDYDDIKTVDAKLVRLGRQLNCNVLTTDYNLNRVASIEGVRVLNINELANAVRPVILPGERMQTRIVQSGKERGQGVGYLADGTMIVVDGGDKLIGQDVQVEITRVFQTVAGKMLFAVIAPGQSLRPTERARKEHNGERQAQQAPAQTRVGERPQRQAQPSRPSNRQGLRDRKPSQRGKDGRAADARQIQSSPRVEARPAQDQQPKSQSPRRSKRTNPSRRLEDSLVELTKEQPAD